jgi:hypothetical protein
MNDKYIGLLYLGGFVAIAYILYMVFNKLTEDTAATTGAGGDQAASTVAEKVLDNTVSIGNSPQTYHEAGITTLSHPLGTLESILGIDDTPVAAPSVPGAGPFGTQ